MLSFLRRKPLLTYVLIGLLTAGFLLIIWQDEERTIGTESADLRGPREPDSFIVNAVYRSYNSQGDLASRIESPRAEQFENDQYALMDEPRATVFEQETRLPWQIDARNGRYNLETELLRLEGDVEVLRENPGLAPSRMLTERLTLDNRQRIVQTDAPVTLLDYRGTTDAVGMEAWIDERVIEFKSQVEGKYVTNTTPDQP